MKIVADENIPLVREFFEEFGELILVPGRTIDADLVHDADVLLVRSVTQVNESLLQGSKVGFVGSATIGVDHLESGALARRGIAVTNAPGCNANSVAEYVLCSLLWLVENKGLRLSDRRVAIVGYGNVGKAVFKNLSTLGLKCIAVDPFLKECGSRDLNGNELVSLEEALNCQVICLHTPLTTAGSHPTHHMIGDVELKSLKPDVILLNAGRGAVIDNAALAKNLDTKKAAGINLHTVLDVWENEPDVDPLLVNKIDLATPHIAGYSMDGKWRGTEMIYNSFCDWKGVVATKEARTFISEASELVDVESFEFHRSDFDILGSLCRLFYDVNADDDAFRHMLNRVGESRVIGFDMLRKHYPVRREFYSKPVLSESFSKEVINKLSRLGFQLKQ